MALRILRAGANMRSSEKTSLIVASFVPMYWPIIPAMPLFLRLVSIDWRVL